MLRKQSHPGAAPGTRSAVSAAALIGALALPLAAATITVDTTDDDLTPNGNCTLREAIEAANTNASVDLCAAGEASPTVDLVALPAGTFDLTLQDGPGGENANQEGDLDILEEVEIAGAGMDSTAIDGQAAERVFHVMVSNVTVLTTFRDLEIRNGLALGNGGGIWSQANLYLYDCRVTGNRSEGAPGGGISHDLSGSVMRIYDSEISGNTTDNSSGGISSIALLELHRSALVDNTASTSAGGIGNALSSTRLYNSTVSGNSAGLNGGGVYAKTLTLHNSTIYGNSAAGGSGGNLIFAGGANARNAIVANPLAGTNCLITGIATPNSDGHNFESPGDTCGFSDATDSTGVVLADLGLTQLLDLGGPTPTHGLFPESVALDTAAAICEAEDQRGELRDDGMCDAGAFEMQAGEDVHVVTAPEAGSFDDGTFGDWIVVGG